MLLEKSGFMLNGVNLNHNAIAPLVFALVWANKAPSGVSIIPWKDKLAHRRPWGQFLALSGLRFCRYRGYADYTRISGFSRGEKIFCSWGKGDLKGWGWGSGDGRFRCLQSFLG